MTLHMKSIAGAGILALVLALPALTPAQLDAIDKAPVSAIEKEVQDAVAAVSPEAVLSKFTEKYANLSAYTTKVSLSAVDPEGNQIPQFPAQDARISFWAPNDLAMDFDALNVFSTEGKLLVAMEQDQSALLLDVPEEGGLEAMMAENPLVGSILGQIPIMGILLSGTEGFSDWTASVTEINGKPAVALTDPEQGMHTMFIDATSGDVLRSQLAMGPADAPRLNIEYAEQAFGEAVKKTELSTAIPEGYQDITQQVMAMMRGPEELIGQKAPDFSLQTLAGEKVRLSDQKGKVVVMDFWATWCPPCKEGMPILQKLATEMKDEKVVFWAMNTDEDPMEERKEKIDDFTTSKNITMTQVMTGEAEAVMTDYMIKSIPTTFIIGPDGLIQNVHVGLLPNLEDTLRKEIQDAMKVE